MSRNVSDHSGKPRGGPPRKSLDLMWISLNVQRHSKLILPTLEPWS
jgi:hypothetical protein